MSSQKPRPDTEKILGVLKDFQRRTVDYVFQRMYTAPDAVRRFLVADEVGLGKTLVARGVIAKAINHIWDTIDRIDIVYICSNRDIAKQNVNRLNVTGEEDMAFASRMTMLPTVMHRLHGNKINFVSFTPGTSFNLRSSGGVWRERALIYYILRDGWRLGDSNGPKKVLQCGVETKNWRKNLATFEAEEIDEELAHFYLRQLKETDLRRRFRNLAKHFARFRRYIPSEYDTKRYELVGELRAVLARSCVDALEPDLIILDEFQRFRHLLNGEDEVARLAQAVFDYPDAKVLLLSATPYKMYTMYHEQEENHYEDFINTAQFLFNCDRQTKAFADDLGRYRRVLLNIGSGDESELVNAKCAIEEKLRRVMVRTERLAATADRSGMVVQAQGPMIEMAPQDLRHFSGLDRVARHLDVGDTVEYWKSAPYLLNLMDREGYKIKRQFISAVDDGANVDLTDSLSAAQEHLLQWGTVKRYKPVEPANAKLRVLMAEMIDCGAWRLLWVPPSMPYYQVTEGPYVGQHMSGFTKALVFSSWMVVPKAIAMLCSYDAERQMVRASETRPDYETLTRRRRNLLRFAFSQGRLTGMSNFALLYPCLTLATKIDPMAICARLVDGGNLPTIETVTQEVRDRIERLVQPILDRYAGPSVQADEAWYWVAPVLLDRHHCRRDMKRWLDVEEGKLAWKEMVRTQEDTESRFGDHVERLIARFHANEKLGRPPDDLVDVLTKVALASPATVTLRSLLRMCGSESARIDAAVPAAAARIAMGFRTLFNLPQSITVVRSLRGTDESPYWETVLDYCANGNIQAVMDEYVHILRESLGLIDCSQAKVAGEIGDEAHAALSIQTVSLFFDEIGVKSEGEVELTRHAMRCRYALRFGDARSEEEKSDLRKEVVRKAFNSPFHPFILASTSIGQEGLDFHQYCHRIFHWNLPGNPVDLEQREGRIHRYKGHVIRRNVAKAFPLSQLTAWAEHLCDPWEAAFALAQKTRPEGADDLVPYWIYEVPDGYKVYRHIPSLPLSRDEKHLQRLLDTLVAYRMVLGQPRQEDLLDFLQSRLGHGLGQDGFLKYQIDLAPPGGP